MGEGLPKALTDLLEAKAARVLLPAGVVQVFDDPGAVWLIDGGIGDLFAVQRRGGYQTGPREHLAGLAPGGLIWGIDQSSGDDGIHLLVQPDLDMHVYRVDLSTLRDILAEPDAIPGFSAALDHWVEALCDGVAKYLAPRKAPELSIGPGEEVAAEDCARVGSRKGVVWVQILQGIGRFADVTEVMSDDGSAMVPISAVTWLEARNDCKMRGHETRSVVVGDDLARRMDMFHGWVFFTLAYDLRNATTMEIGRLKRRETHVTDATENTFTALAALLEGDARRPTAGAADDQLFECCVQVGRVIGAEMILPAWAKRRRANERPLAIDDIASASSVRIRNVALRGQWWTEDNGALVGFIEAERRPVALLPQPDGSYIAHDPATGQRQAVTEAFADSLIPIAHYFYPSLPSRPLQATDLLAFGLRSAKPDILFLAFAGAMSGMVVTGIPLATGYVFDSVIPGHQSAQMFQVAAAMLVVAFTAAAFHFTADVAQLRIEGRISSTVQAGIMDRLLRLPNNFFSDYSAGDLAQRAMVIETIRNYLTGPVLGSVVSGIFSIFNIAVLIYFSPLAALAAGGIILVLGVVVWQIGIRLMRTAMAAEQLSGRVNSLVLEVVSGVSKLRLAGAEERAFNLWGAKFREMRSNQVRARGLVNVFVTFWSGYELFSLVVMFAIVGTMSGHEVSTGTFLALIAAFTGLMTAAGSLSQSAMAIFSVVPLYKRASPILKAQPETDASKSDPGVLSGEFEVSNVRFRYSADTPPILNGVSLRARPGEFIAVVGPSGSGKSTLMRLLLGFERPEAGGVFFDGHDMRGLDLQRVRNQIGVVLQNGRLMPGSIYENIKGASRASLDDCWEAAAQAGMADDIQAMPMGMHTVLTEGATALSGGQVQRLLIARAIVSKPRILLLDEATSALDNRVQAVVTESLGRLRVTRVVIAHRLSTIMSADRIYVMQAGRLVETGTYKELDALGGVFTELVRRQQL